MDNLNQINQIFINDDKLSLASIKKSLSLFQEQELLNISNKE